MVEFCIEVHQVIQKLVCGSYPNYALPLPEYGEEMLDMIDCFKDKYNKHFLPASELKICTMVLQSCPFGHSPMFHFLAQPQTKNMNSEFNEICVQKVILPVFEACQEEGINTIFLCLSVDGLSCDSKFFRSLFLFLLGTHDYSAGTDCNPNNEN